MQEFREAIRNLDKAAERAERQVGMDRGAQLPADLDEMTDTLVKMAEELDKVKGPEVAAASVPEPEPAAPESTEPPPPPAT